MRKGQRSWERVLAPDSGNKENMAKHKKITFGPIIASVTLKALSLQLNGVLIMWKIQQKIQDDAIRTARIHPAVHPGHRDERLDELWRSGWHRLEFSAVFST